MEPRTVHLSTRAIARLAGILYLIVAVGGGFAQLGARASVFVIGDAAETADRIRASADAMRLGFVGDAVNVTAFILLALVLYRLLAPVSARAAAAFVVFNAIAVAIMGVSLIGHMGSLLLATDPAYASTLGGAQADALSYLFLDLHRHGYLVAEIFFGLWLLPLGYVVARSGFFPRVIGAALVVGGVGYLASATLTMLSPGFEAGTAALVVAIPAGLAEFAFLAWLLVRGVGAPAEGIDRQPSADPLPA
jgi:hypothetical protein